MMLSTVETTKPPHNARPRAAHVLLAKKRRYRLAEPHTAAAPTNGISAPKKVSNVRRVCIYVANKWPASVERTVIEAAGRAKTPVSKPEEVAKEGGEIISDEEQRPWSLLVGSLIALFLSLGGNAYLGLLLGGMRARYLSLVRERIPQGFDESA